MMRPPAAALALAEALLADVINRDESSRAGLVVLDGSIVALTLRGIEIEFFVTVTGPRLALHRELDREPQVRISGTPSAFARLLRGTDAAAPVATQDAVDIQGNLAIATAWQNWLRQLDLDWEEWLATLIGDLPARRIVRGAHGLRGWTDAAAATLADDIGEYLRHEAALTPDRARIVASGAAIQRLAQDVDAIALRVQRLLARRDSDA